MRNKIYILILFVLLMAGKNGFSQNDSVAKAVLLLQDQKTPADVRVKQALEVIDRAIINPQSAKNAYAWYVRGFVYKDWYKTFESQNKKSKTRLKAVEFLKKALELDTVKEYHTDIKAIIKHLGSKFQNDAAELLETGDTINIGIALENYEHFKECMMIAEPTYNLKYWEINFKTVLADKYAIIFRKDINSNVRFFRAAEANYRQVLALDTNNWAGNYNLAMLYYNYGVDIINVMEVSSDIPLIENIQEEARSLFKQALPYALKSYALNPKYREILVCLQGIYFSLYEIEKSDEFKAKVELLDKEK